MEWIGGTRSRRRFREFCNALPEARQIQELLSVVRYKASR